LEAGAALVLDAVALDGELRALEITNREPHWPQ